MAAPHGKRALCAFLHSPLLTGSSWGGTPELFRAAGFDALVVEVSGDDREPFARRYVAAAAAQLEQAHHGRPVVLIGHSGAGPLLPAVRAAVCPGVTVPAIIYCDANLPRPGANRLDLTGLDPAQREQLLLLLATGWRYPSWTDEYLAGVERVTDPAQRALLLDTVNPRDEAYLLEPLPYAPVHPTITQGYLQLSARYGPEADRAQTLGWPLTRLDHTHFHALVDPEGTAAALTTLTRRCLAPAAVVDGPPAPLGRCSGPSGAADRTI
ncbi:hypothetical protein [Actinophytocola sp.]|uniref:hypothetical protein n=1 Tax=Actinophytocola sp. TaxID=1872138 RepID=UPI002D810DC5|nr:hypothetical protein [Actinophytocola sp.]HET9140053.1 hypothetical protein [Actinophytocola sp.]